LLFAGSYGARGAAFYSDVWLFDTTTETWSEIVVDGATPPGRRTPWVSAIEDAEGSLRGFYAGFGYDGGMRPRGDLHYFDVASASWTELTLDPGAACSRFRGLGIGAARHARSAPPRARRLEHRSRRVRARA
jgi:hypothetical protein